MPAPRSEAVAVSHDAEGQRSSASIATPGPCGMGDTPPRLARTAPGALVFTGTLTQGAPGFRHGC